MEHNQKLWGMVILAAEVNGFTSHITGGKDLLFALFSRCSAYCVAKSPSAYYLLS